MKALFGVVSLLVVLAVVGILATRQLKAVSQMGSSPAVAAATGVAPSSAAAAGQTVREQSQQLQQRVGDDVKKALEQGAAARGDESQK
jgi:hypothetical protein